MTTATRTIKKLQDGVAGLLTRKNLSSVTNLFGAFERALRTFQGKATIPEAMTSQIVTLYDGVYSYPAVSPIFGSTVRDARPVGQTRNNFDQAKRISGEDFDRKKLYSTDGYDITFETENGVNIMRVNTSFTPQRVIIDPMNDSTGWTVGGSLSNLATDTTFYYRGPASLRFTVTGASSGYIEKTLSNSVDLSSYADVGVAFIPIELPSLNLTSVELRLGSDDTNYYAMTATASQLGAWLAGDFSDTPFSLSGATKVGTPDISAIAYVRVTLTHSATITNMRLGYLSISLPSQHKFLFTTTGIFKHTDGTISNEIGDQNDEILLNDSAYNIYEAECAIAVGLQEGGSLSSGQLANITSELNGARARNGQVIALGLYDKFRADNPSDDIRQAGNWYND